MKGQDVIFSSKTNNWITNPSFLSKLDDIFKFKIDPCPSPFFKHKCFRTNFKNGLVSSWDGHTFINPPYSNYDLWVEKTYYESKRYYQNYFYVMLLPVRTDTKIFQTLIVNDSQLIVFLKGRQKFYKWNKDTKTINQAISAPFPSMLVIYTKTEITIDLIKALSEFGIVFGTSLKNKLQKNDLFRYFNLS